MQTSNAPAASSSDESNEARWYPGFEWLRCLFISFVLILHLNLPQQFARLSGNGDLATVFDYLLYQVFCLAVPGFLLISVFLQVRNFHEWDAIGIRMKQLFFLYAFWMCAWILFAHARPEPGVWGLATFLLRGGGWTFYFFASLIIVQFFAVMLRTWSTRYLSLGLAVLAILIAVLFVAMAHNDHSWTKSENYWWPVSFLPIPFIALLLVRFWPFLEENIRRYRWALGVIILCFLAAGMAEWSFAAQAGHLQTRPFLPVYFRLSPLLGAVFLVLIALKMRYAPWLVQFISRNCLGIFCIHVFILRGVDSGVREWIGHSVWSSLGSLALLLIGCAYATELLRKLFRERLI